MRPQNINRITGVEFACRGFENVNLNVIYTSSLFVVFMFLQHGIALSCTDAIMDSKGGTKRDQGLVVIGYSRVPQAHTFLEISAIAFCFYDCIF
jgi:hypothetical protein